MFSQIRFLSEVHKPHNFDNQEKAIDISEVNNLLAGKDYDVIVKSPDLFLTLFTKALANVKLDGADGLVFQVTEKGNVLKIKTYSHLFSYSFVQAVEKLRVIFERTMYKGHVTVLPIEIVQGSQKRIYFMEPQSTSADLRDLDPYFTCQSERFHTYVKPSLKGVAELLGGVYSEKKIMQVLRTPQRPEDSVPEIDAFRIDWTAEEHYVSNMAPVGIPGRESMQMHLYRMFKDNNQTNCDLTLVSCDGKELKMHGVVMHTYGGLALRTMLESTMRESLERRIVFGETPFDVLQEFVEFLYLGADALRPKVFFNTNVDPCALLHLAVVYEIDPLIKCCTNLLYIGASTEQAKEVKELAELYNVRDLKLLAEHLEVITAKKMRMELE